MWKIVLSGLSPLALLFAATLSTPAAAQATVEAVVAACDKMADQNPGSCDYKIEGNGETLRNLGNALNQELKDETAFVIEGHTDRTGTRAYNDALSKHRADTVKEYLVKEMGVSAERLKTVGKGFSEPIDPKHPYAADNRRVVMINAGTS